MDISATTRKSTQNGTIKNHVSVSNNTKEAVTERFTTHTQIREKSERYTTHTNIREKSERAQIGDTDEGNDERSNEDDENEHKQRINTKQHQGKMQLQSIGDVDEIQQEDIKDHKEFKKKEEIDQVNLKKQKKEEEDKEQLRQQQLIQQQADIHSHQQQPQQQQNQQNPPNNNNNNSNYSNIQAVGGSSNQKISSNQIISSNQKIPLPNSSLLQPNTSYLNNTPLLNAFSNSPHLQNQQYQASSNLNNKNSSLMLSPILQAQPSSQSSLMADKSNSANSIDEEKMIMEVIYAGMISDLKHFKMSERSLNYLREFEQLASIDKRVSPLIVAVFCGNIDHVRQLFNLNSIIDVNFASRKNQLSPLMVACMRGQFEIVQYLLAKGADLNQVNIDGLSSLYYCFSRLEEERNYFENKNLCMKMAVFLLANGSNINQIVNADNKHTLLMQFCNIQDELNDREKDINLSMIRFFLCNGADVTLKNSQGQDCYGLIQRHPYRDEVQQIFEQYENTLFSHSKTLDFQNDGRQPFQLPQNLLKSTSNNKKKRSNNILTSQSTARLNTYNNNNMNASYNNIGGFSMNNSIHASGASYNPYNTNSNNSPNNSRTQKTQPQPSNTLPSKHNPDMQLEGEEPKSKPCCSFFLFRF